MTNQELIDAGKKTMDETDQAIERTQKVKNELLETGDFIITSPFIPMLNFYP